MPAQKQSTRAYAAIAPAVGLEGQSCLIHGNEDVQMMQRGRGLEQYAHVLVCRLSDKGRCLAPGRGLLAHWARRRRRGWRVYA